MEPGSIGLRARVWMGLELAHLFFSLQLGLELGFRWT